MAMTFVGPVTPGRRGLEMDFRLSAGPRSKGLVTRVRGLDLGASQYVSGGWPLTSADTRLSVVNGMDVLADYDFSGEPVDHVGVSFRLDRTDLRVPKLRMFTDVNVEAVNGSTRTGVVWFRFYGSR